MVTGKLIGQLDFAMPYGRCELTLTDRRLIVRSSTPERRWFGLKGSRWPSLASETFPLSAISTATLQPPQPERGMPEGMLTITAHGSERSWLIHPRDVRRVYVFTQLLRAVLREIDQLCDGEVGRMTSHLLT